MDCREAEIIVKTRCSKCTRLQSVDAFPISTRGPQAGQRTKTCGLCLEMSRKYKTLCKEQAKKNVSTEEFNIAPKLCSLDSFVSTLAGYQHVVHLEASFEIPNVENASPKDYRIKADNIVRRTSDVMGYLFRYHSSSTTSSKSRYLYHCAQNKERYKPQDKIQDPKRQRIKTSMPRFDCHGWMSITIWHERWEATVKIQHKNGHAPYHAKSLPDDVKGLIKDRYQEPVAQLWDAVLKLYPTPQFTRRAVYYLWSKLNGKLDPDRRLTEEETRSVDQAGVNENEVQKMPVH